MLIVKKGYNMNSMIRKKINELAYDVLTLYNIQVPVDNMRQVVKRIGGKVLEDDSLGLYSDGNVKKNGDSFIINIPPNQPITRENFTIAHELGHLFLHMGYLIDPDKWDKSDSIEFHRRGNSVTENQANEFAAAFLMPQAEYIKIMNQNTEGNLVNVGNIANYFHVSVDAASYRGKWLGYLQW